MNYKIALIRGDGIGPEVVNEAVKVMEKVGELSLIHICLHLVDLLLGDRQSQLHLHLAQAVGSAGAGGDGAGTAGHPGANRRDGGPSHGYRLRQGCCV